MFRRLWDLLPDRMHRTSILVRLYPDSVQAFENESPLAASVRHLVGEAEFTRHAGEVIVHKVTFNLTPTDRHGFRTRPISSITIAPIDYPEEEYNVKVPESLTKGGIFGRCTLTGDGSDPLVTMLNLNKCHGLDIDVTEPEIFV